MAARPARLRDLGAHLWSKFSSAVSGAPPVSRGGRGCGLFVQEVSTISTRSGSHFLIQQVKGNHPFKGPQNYNKKLPNGNSLDGFIVGVKDAAPKAAFGLVFSGSIFIYFYVILAMDRINAQMEALCDKLEAFIKEMKQRNERGHATLNSMGSQTEAGDIRDVVGKFLKGQRKQTSGQGKD